MAQELIYNSLTVDFVNGSTPRTVAIYTVPAGQLLALTSVRIITVSITGSGVPAINIGNSNNSTAYNQTRDQITFLQLSDTAQEPQTIAAGTSIIATIVTNSSASAQMGYILIEGVLNPVSGSDNPVSYPATQFSLDFSDLQNNYLSFSSASIVNSSTGGSKNSWSQVITPTQCSLQPISGSKYEYCKKLQIKVSHVAYFEVVMPLAINYMANDGTDNYQVTYWEDQGGMGVVFAVYLNKVLDGSAPND